MCHLCGGPSATTADHVIPRKHGGSNALSNLAPAHLSCNSARGSMTLEEWFASTCMYVILRCPYERSEEDTAVTVYG